MPHLNKDLYVQGVILDNESDAKAAKVLKRRQYATQRYGSDITVRDLNMRRGNDSASESMSMKEEWSLFRQVLAYNEPERIFALPNQEQFTESENFKGSFFNMVQDQTKIKDYVKNKREFIERAKISTNLANFIIELDDDRDLLNLNYLLDPILPPTICMINTQFVFKNEKGSESRGCSD